MALRYEGEGEFRPSRSKSSETYVGVSSAEGHFESSRATATWSETLRRRPVCSPASHRASMKSPDLSAEVVNVLCFQGFLKCLLQTEVGPTVARNVSSFRHLLYELLLLQFAERAGY